MVGSAAGWGWATKNGERRASGLDLVSEFCGFQPRLCHGQPSDPLADPEQGVLPLPASVPHLLKQLTFVHSLSCGSDRSPLCARHPSMPFMPIGSSRPPASRAVAVMTQSCRWGN